MRAQPADEALGIEPFRQNFVESQHGGSIVALEEVVGQLEVIVVVEDVQVLDHLLVAHFLAAERHCLVEERERITHCPVGFLCDDVHGIFTHRNFLLGSDVLHVAHHVLNADAVEVVGLAAGKDGGEYLVFLGGGQDEDGMCRRFLKSLEESIEGRLRQHVHLVDDIYAVAAHLRRDAHLVGQCTDVVDRVVGCCVQLVYAVRTPFGERAAGLAFSARFELRPGIAAIDGLGEYPGRACLAHAARAAEEVCMCKLAALYRVLERACDVLLSQQRLEAVRTIFPGRYDELFHSLQR